MKKKNKAKCFCCGEWVLEEGKEFKSWKPAKEHKPNRRKKISQEDFRDAVIDWWMYLTKEQRDAYIEKLYMKEKNIGEEEIEQD